METTIDLRTYIVPLRRWWWLVLLSTLIAGGTSAAVTYLQPPLYQSRTTVMLGNAIQNPNPTGMEFYLAQQLLGVYSEIIKRPSVRADVMEALGITQLPQYTVSVAPNTQFMEVVVTDTNAERAQAVAAELIRQLILRTPAGNEEQSRQAFVAEELDELERSIRLTKDEIARRESEFANMLGARQIADNQNQINALQQKLTTLQGNYANLLATTQRGAVNTLHIVEPALVPSTPLPSNLLQNALLAAAIGLALGAGAAFLLEYMDDSIRAPEQIQELVGLPVLAAVPALSEADRKDGELIMLTNPFSQRAEAYRVLRTNLQFASIDRPLHTILVTSSMISEGKTVTAGNLASSLAQAGHRTLLIDADMHRPRQHKLFGLVNNVGLTTALLTEHDDPAEFAQATDNANLMVMSTGPLPPNPAELLGSQRMRALLSALRNTFEYIIIDTPPVLVLTDAAVLSTQVDGVVLVATAGESRAGALKRAAAMLRQINAPLTGVLLNKLTRSAGGYGYYYYYYYSDDGYYNKSYRRKSRKEAAPLPTAAIIPAQNGQPSLRPAREASDGNA